MTAPHLRPAPHGAAANHGFGALTGLDHIGIGVTDMAASLRFYSELGFEDVAFDVTADLPGLTGVSGYDETSARVVLLRSDNPTVLGRAAVKLVSTTSRANPPTPAGMAWGEPGICEVCVHVHGQAEFHARLVADGHTSLMEPNEADLDPYRTHCGLSYVSDPDGTKIELIEWSTLQAGWPVVDGPQGVNHVAFGVTDIDRTREFYRALGFTGQLFESDGYFEPMHPWYAPRTPPRQRMMLLTSPLGGNLEPVQHTPASPDMRGEWGHLGTYEFAIGSRCLERSLDHLDRLGIELAGRPATVDLGGGASWSYAYFKDPDGLYVCVSEVRA
jgi:catechol 2,3-dioxygenase-like lactoylglutathione lyase family enzyme